MGGILNGMSLHKGLRPFGGTFLVFADYMRPSIRLAALMGIAQADSPAAYQRRLMLADRVLEHPGQLEPRLDRRVGVGRRISRMARARKRKIRSS